MQTRRNRIVPGLAGRYGRINAGPKRIAAACLSSLASVGLLVSLTGCAAPRYVGRAESEQTMSDCERSYYTASSAHEIARSDGGQPLIMRYIAARSARLQWIDVAATCADRLDEGVIRSAQDDRTARDIAQRFGFADDAYIYSTDADGDAAVDDANDAEGTADDATNGNTSGDAADETADDGTSDIATANVTDDLRAATLAGTDSLSISTNALTAMALAEDRAGFSTEVLAARSSDGITMLALADAHKATGERLISLARSGAQTDATKQSGTSQSDSSAQSGTSSANGSAQSSNSTVTDPRQKVYDVSQLIANVNAITDPATGLTAPTYAAVEINCAREELAAFAQSSSTQSLQSNSSPDTAQSDSRSQSNDSTAQSSAKQSQSSAQSPSTQSDNSVNQSVTAQSAAAHTASMRTIAKLIAARVAQSLAAGYPTTDHALFS